MMNPEHTIRIISRFQSSQVGAGSTCDDAFAPGARTAKRAANAEASGNATQTVGRDIAGAPFRIIDIERQVLTIDSVFYRECACRGFAGNFFCHVSMMKSEMPLAA
jgi:hypothetical protein